MSSNPFFFPLAAAGATAFALVAAIFVPYNYSLAADDGVAAGARPELRAFDIRTVVPEIKDAKIVLDQSDEYAALEAVHFGLTEVADGASYIWRRENGHLSGLVKPVASFKDTRGDVCRHAVVVLTAAEGSKSTEIVACRLPTGIWQVES
jgi:surface antigen